MRSNQIAFLSLFLCVVGLMVLFFLASQIEPKEIKISKITEQELGSFVKVSGEIKSISVHNGNIFFDLCERSACIKTVFFIDFAVELKQNSFNPYLLKEGEKLQISGTVEEYSGELEIIPLHYLMVEKID